MKRIITTINRQTGAMTVKTEGYVGPECQQGAAAELEKALGMNQEGACTLTDEYFANKEENKDQVGGA